MLNAWGLLMTPADARFAPCPPLRGLQSFPQSRRPRDGSPVCRGWIANSRGLLYSWRRASFSFEADTSATFWPTLPQA
jgi:hypothetical protein